MGLQLNPSRWSWILLAASNKRPTNLCQFTAAILESLFVGACIVLIGGVTSFLLLVVPVMLWLDALPDPLMFAVVSMFFWTLAAIVLITMYRQSQHYRDRGGAQQRQPSAIVEYIRARKEKVCPTISWRE